MHKFFCSYNILTQKYELTNMRGFKSMTTIQAENTLLPEIRQNIQLLYENIVLLKEQEKDEARLNLLDETELMISNLYYSLFETPLELIEEKSKNASLKVCIELIGNLLKTINIPEYSRLCMLIQNNLNTLIA